MNTKQLIPETWKTSHLIVLVGGNPLPNYVAGKTLLQENGVLHLLHSVATREIAERIGAQFGDEGKEWFAIHSPIPPVAATL